MAIINEIKCARCDRKYSGVRSRCPYCGARRIGRGKYSENSDNARGKMLISVLIMAVFVVGAGVLLFTSPGEADAGDIPDEDLAVTNPEDDVDQVQTLTPSPTPELVEPEEPEEEEVIISSVVIRFSGNPREEFTAKIGEMVPLRVTWEPPGSEPDIEWMTSDPNIFDVIPVTVNEGERFRRGAEVTGIGEGWATLTVSVGGVEATCRVFIVLP